MGKFMGDSNRPAFHQSSGGNNEEPPLEMQPEQEPFGKNQHDFNLPNKALPPPPP
jgi:hypothetical protein